MQSITINSTYIAVSHLSISVPSHDETSVDYQTISLRPLIQQ